MSRKLRIPGLFLCALALGVWIGASWHTAAQPLGLSGSGDTCGSCCRFGSAKQNKEKRAQLKAGDRATICAVCQAGVLVQDAPRAVVTVAPLMSLAPESASTLVSACVSAQR